MDLRFYIDPETGFPHIHSHGVEEDETESKMKSTTNFPPGWDEDRVSRLLQHYESMSEDEAAFEDSTQTVMQIPNELVSSVRALLSERTG